VAIKKKIIIGSIVAGVFAAGLLTVTRTLYPTNVAETSPVHEEEKLRSRRYRTDLKTFAAETQRIIPKLSSWGKNWKYVSTDQTENSAVVKAEVPVVFFTDDLAISAEKDAADGAIVVNVRSNSRVGKSDFGENRRHVLRILEALDAKFLR
jgi:uncharacterized protein (DUF1499 family)